MNYQANWIPETQKSLDRKRFIKEKYLNRPILNKKEPVEKKRFFFTMENENTDPPIFIIGCGHSGTTILRKMIGSHSQIYDIGYETDLLLKPIDSMEKLHKVVRKVEELNKSTVLHKKKRWIEKTPRHVHQIDIIKRFFPESKIIILTRNPISCIKSLHHRYKNLKESVTRYINDNMAWLHSNHKSSFHIVKYEDLIQNTQVIIEQILQFIGVEYEDITKYNLSPNVINYDDRICSRCSSKNIRRTTCFGSFYHCTMCTFHGAYADIPNIRHRQLRDSQVNQPLFDKIEKDEDIGDFTEKQKEYLLNVKVNDITIEKISEFMDYSTIKLNHL